MVGVPGKPHLISNALRIMRRTASRFLTSTRAFALSSGLHSGGGEDADGVDHAEAGGDTDDNLIELPEQGQGFQFNG